MIAAAHDEMIRAALVSPVELGGADERLWLDCDLASLAENRLGDRTDPRGLGKAKRAEWRKHATTERPYPLESRNTYERCYWLLEGGERVGTIAVAKSTMGGAAARVASFYVFPTLRSRGVGRRALARLAEILSHHGIGIRLETSWTWQRTVRFYLRAGMWVYMWKRDLSLSMFPDMPPPHIEIGEQEARISVRCDGEDIVLQRARRRGDALDLDEMPGELQKDERIGEAWWQATSTLALALALAGFPLIRSPEAWAQQHYADAGAPEALAYKIQVWEAWDRHRGWIVETSKIPGLAYPTWAELTAKWDRENAEFQEKMKRGEPV